MKTFTISCALFVLVAATLGTAQILQTNTRQEIGRCFEDAVLMNSTKCSETREFLKYCLGMLDPANDVEKLDVKEAMTFVMERDTVCPSFTYEQSCVENEVTACMGDFVWSKLFNSLEICDQTAKARRCLANLNNACNKDVVRFDRWNLDIVDQQCAAGYWNDGPCSPRVVLECTKGVLYVVVDSDDAKPSFSCEKADVDRVNKCLTALAHKCSTQHQQDEIAHTFKQLENSCPSNK